MNSGVPQISVRDASIRLATADHPRLIDVREADEWETARIAGAELVPLSAWPQIVAEKLPEKDQELIIQCHHGGRSERAAAYLLSQGYTRVWNLAGGIDAWSQAVDTAVPRY